MEERKTVFDLIGQIFIVFGFQVICMMVFGVIFGEDAKAYSSMFALGDEGIAISTLMQYLLMAGIITIIRQIFFTDMLIKTWPVPVRTICMFVSVIVTIVVFIVAFQWFPVEKVMAWVMFLCCFVVCALGAIGISLLKEKTDNRKMQEALERMQNGKNETDGN